MFVHFALQLRELAVAQFGGAIEVAFALGAVGRLARLLQLRLQ